MKLNVCNLAPNIKGGFGLADIDHASLAEIHGKCFDDCWNAETFIDLCCSSTCLTLIHLNELEVIDGLLLINFSGLEADITTICVDPVKQKCGIAGSLLNTAIELLKCYGCMSIFLEVAENNTAACRIYEKNGFKMIGTRKKYYNNGLSAYTMKKNLDLDATNHDKKK